MSSFYFYIVLWILNFGSYDTVSLRNKAKVSAETAYTNKDYLLASTYYKQVLNYTLFVEPEVRLDLGHSYFLLGDTKGATRQYQRLVHAQSAEIATMSLNQMGVLSNNEGAHQKALAYLKEALQVNPNNEIARYNYELLKKQHPTMTPPPPPESPKNTSKPPPPPQQAPKQQAELEKSEKKEDVLHTLKQYDLTEEKARMILDAMKAGEVQYIQQRQYKTAETKKTKQNW
ncbi:MAG: hypothetical protein U0Y10_18915 [Spirosomataceae bacterium]